MNPTVAENQLAGDVSWNQFTRSVGGQVEAYAERVSAKAGESVQIMARSSAAAGASWTLYRLGWYGGAGARQTGAGTAQLGSQPACANEAATGLVRCSWAPTFSLAVPEDAVSGLYLVRIVRDDKVGAFWHGLRSLSLDLAHQVLGLAVLGYGLTWYVIHKIPVHTIVKRIEHALHIAQRADVNATHATHSAHAAQVGAKTTARAMSGSCTFVALRFLPKPAR